jgi:hypothetical protein
MFVVNEIPKLTGYCKKFCEKPREVGDVCRQYCKFNDTSLNIQVLQDD